MEDLRKQGGGKQRKMETKIDSRSQTHNSQPNKEKIKEKVEEQIVKEMAKEIKEESTDKPVDKNMEGMKTQASATETKAEKKIENKPVAKKDMAYIKMNGLSMSTKQSREIGRFLIGKTPEQAIDEMIRVTKQKMAVPMRGEIPHRKGPMMSGRFPINTAKVFINVLKSLAGNASVNGIRNPVITIASASWAARPKRKGGMRFKRTHLYMEVREAKEKYNNNKNQKKNNPKVTNKENKMENKN